MPFEEQTRAQTHAELLPQMGDAVNWYLHGLADAVTHPLRRPRRWRTYAADPATTYAEWAVAYASEFRPHA